MSQFIEELYSEERWPLQRYFGQFHSPI